MTAVAVPDGSIELPGPFALESGESLPSVTVAHRTWGRLDAKGDNAVLVCHALTGSADVDRWWGALLGPGRSLDPDRDFVVPYYYQLIDRTPKGRRDEFRAWRHDEYEETGR